MDFVSFIRALLLFVLNFGAGIAAEVLPEAKVIFDALACIVAEFTFDSCPAGYHKGCSSGRQCCPCEEGTFMTDPNNCTQCQLYKDCTGKLITFKGNSTHDRECEEPIDTTGTSTLPQEAFHQTEPSSRESSSTEVSIPPTDRTPTDGGVIPGKPSYDLWGVLYVVLGVIIILLLFIYRKEIRRVMDSVVDRLSRCRQQEVIKQPPPSEVPPQQLSLLRSSENPSRSAEQPGDSPTTPALNANDEIEVV